MPYRRLKYKTLILRLEHFYAATDFLLQPMYSEEPSLVDLNDNLSWDLAGFDPGVPRLIQMLTTGDL